MNDRLTRFSHIFTHFKSHKIDYNKTTFLFHKQIVLNSMHRYQPRIHLIVRSDPSSINIPVTDLSMEKYRTFVFPETIFTAVTAYQNQLVSHLYFMQTIITNYL